MLCFKITIAKVVKIRIGKVELRKKNQYVTIADGRILSTMT